MMWFTPFLFPILYANGGPLIAALVLLPAFAVQIILFFTSLVALGSARRRNNPWIILSLILSALFIAGGILAASNYKYGPGP